MVVIKRDGREVDFDKNKIYNAIAKANQEASPTEKLSEKGIAGITDCVVNQCKLKNRITVEQIQDNVETMLMEWGVYEVAKLYIRYRYLHKLARNQYDDLMDAISQKLSASNVENQNANLDEHSFGGRMGEATRLITKKFALDYCMSDMARQNHLNNEIYIHDLDSYAVGEHNCFQRDTEFITDDGIKKFRDYHDGDVVLVLCSDGLWRPATVRMYGKQPMNCVTFKRAGITKTVNCTSNHRWILHDGTITESLQVGDRLASIEDSRNDFHWYSGIDSRAKDMFCFGFILGDGCDHSGRIQARLCGEKVKYATVFRDCHFTENKIKDSQDVLFVKKTGYEKQTFLTTHAWNLLSFNDKRALFEGYMCADGSTNDVSTKIVWTSDERILAMIQDISCLAGYHIHSIKTKVGDTNYKKHRTLYEVVLTTKTSPNSAWTVTAIDRQPNNEYEAWCVEEPETHSFTLAGGMVTGNCLSVPFDKLLANGFNTRQTDVRPANSVNTAFQLVAVIFQLQSLQQFGGVSATHLDWTMVPYVRKSFYKHFMDGMKYVQDYIVEPGEFTPELPIYAQSYKRFELAYNYAIDMTVRETKQAVEGMYHNLNTLQSRSGNQLPFTSINYGTCTLPEGRMVIKALLEVSIEGLGRLHKTSIFPCGIFQLANGINRKPGDPNYDLFRLALKSTTLRLYPNYANVDWSGNAGYNPEDPRTIFSTMGCRTANGWDINGLEQQKDGRGNICPVTIILPTLAMETVEMCDTFTKENQPNLVDMFLEILDKKLFEARDMLKERYHWICQQNPDSAKFMYENGLMEGYDGESVESAMKHGTLAVGMLGMAETLQILVGCDHTDPKGMEVAKRICQLYKDRCAQFKEEEKLNFGVYYSPAENLCYTAMKNFKAKYGEIPNVSDKEFFTNSIHVPVWTEINPFEKIDIESQLTGFSSAGCITYVELDATCKNNLDALETLVNYAMDHDVPYFAVNVPNDTCMSCGFTEEIGDSCPVCGGRDIQRLRRVTGLS